MTRLPVSRRTAVVPLPELVLLSQFAVPLTPARTRPYDDPILAVGEPDGEGESIPSNFIEATREIGVWPSDHGMEEGVVTLPRGSLNKHPKHFQLNEPAGAVQSSAVSRIPHAGPRADEAASAPRER
uniref:Uncharacterized protein n=1 Tax=Oryza meridionalis TaxID=40149 RepID=A0A0E0C5U1_9ORYZ